MTVDYILENHESITNDSWVNMSMTVHIDVIDDPKLEHLLDKWEWHIMKTQSHLLWTQ